MCRRDFLRLLGATAAVAASAPVLEQLLWTPSTSIIVPSLPIVIGPRVGNTFITPGMLTREWVRVFEDQMRAVKLFNREYDTLSRQRRDVAFVVDDQWRQVTGVLRKA